MSSIVPDLTAIAYSSRSQRPNFQPTVNTTGSLTHSPRSHSRPVIGWFCFATAEASAKDSTTRSPFTCFPSDHTPHTCSLIILLFPYLFILLRV